MSYTPPPLLPNGALAGNPTGSPINQAEAVLVDSTLSVSGIGFGAASIAPKTTTGNYTILSSDNFGTLISGDTTAVNLTLPAGIANGFKCVSLQGNTGVITYVAGSGATILSGTGITSAGQSSNGNKVNIENIGNDNWIITGSLA